MSASEESVVHTPGPWRLAANGRTVIAGPINITQHTGPAAQSASVIEQQSRELMANAKLIASSPELLHACELLLMLSLPQDVSGMAMVEVARRTVRKARGLG